MAKGQRRGWNSTTVGMIVFVGLWLASTVFLVILYTSQEALSKDAESARDARARLASSQEERSIELIQTARKGGPTAVALLEGARSETAGLATGEPGDDPAAVEAKLDQFLATIRSEAIVPQPGSFVDLSYHETLVSLYRVYSDTHALQVDAARRLEDLQAEVGRMVEASTKLKSDLDKRGKELADQLAAVETGRAQYGAQRDEEVARLVREFDERRLHHDADLTEERQRAATLAGRVSALQDRFIAMQEKFGDLMIGPEELSTARQPDGRILKAVPGDEVVYIDLGEKDMLTRGLQFAVYSADAGIPADGRGKARIEVASISETSAECKIVAVAGYGLIMEGDLIANPVYDPDRPLRFVVLGDFDLDHDGRIDQSGAAAVESMITNRGGELAATLTALTDFVVLGNAPRRPRVSPDATPEQTQRRRAAQALFDRYTETLATARSLAVPILTQEVFLNFLGYTGLHARR